jgi:hypothetical protein
VAGKYLRGGGQKLIPPHPGPLPQRGEGIMMVCLSKGRRETDFFFFPAGSGNFLYVSPTGARETLQPLACNLQTVVAQILLRFN